MTTDEQILVYRSELKAAFIAYMDGDMETWTKFRNRWPNPELDALPKEVEQAGVMKAVTGSNDMPLEYRQRAKKWLDDRKMGSQDDGDV